MGDLAERTDREGKGRIIVTGIEMLDPGGIPIHEVVSGSEVRIRVLYHVREPGPHRKGLICMTFYKDLENYFGLSTGLSSKEELLINGDGYVDFHIRSWPLAGGRSRFDVYLECNSEMQDLVSDAGYIDTVDGDFFGSGKVCHDDYWRNYVLVPHTWSQKSA
jgi:hypothetical protein